MNILETMSHSNLLFNIIREDNEYDFISTVVQDIYYASIIMGYRTVSLYYDYTAKPEYEDYRGLVESDNSDVAQFWAKLSFNVLEDMLFSGRIFVTGHLEAVYPEEDNKESEIRLFELTREELSGIANKNTKLYSILQKFYINYRACMARACSIRNTLNDSVFLFTYKDIRNLRIMINTKDAFSIYGLELAKAAQIFVSTASQNKGLYKNYNKRENILEYNLLDNFSEEVFKRTMSICSKANNCHDGIDFVSKIRLIFSKDDDKELSEKTKYTLITISLIYPDNVENKAITYIVNVVGTDPKPIYIYDIFRLATTLKNSIPLAMDAIRSIHRNCPFLKCTIEQEFISEGDNIVLIDTDHEYNCKETDLDELISYSII